MRKGKETKRNERDLKWREREREEAPSFYFPFVTTVSLSLSPLEKFSVVLILLFASRSGTDSTGSPSRFFSFLPLAFPFFLSFLRAG